ncbi:MAG: TssQ family T6SS-associated lipoprotein [Azonexus sp.]
MKPNSVRLRTCLSLFALLLLSAGCVPNNVKEAEPPPKESRELPKPVAPAPVAVSPQAEKAQQELLGGIASYENGSYKVAARQLQAALALGLEGRGNQARAHKYLAFMHCVGGRQAPCRDEFRKALEADPAFELSPAEAGHPTWGPVFRKLKAKSVKPKK